MHRQKWFHFYRGHRSGYESLWLSHWRDSVIWEFPMGHQEKWRKIGSLNFGKNSLANQFFNHVFPKFFITNCRLLTAQCSTSEYDCHIHNLIRLIWWWYFIGKSWQFDSKKIEINSSAILFSIFMWFHEMWNYNVKFLAFFGKDECTDNFVFVWCV